MLTFLLTLQFNFLFFCRTGSGDVTAVSEIQVDKNGAVVPEEMSIKGEADSKGKKWKATRD